MQSQPALGGVTKHHIALLPLNITLEWRHQIGDAEKVSSSFVRYILQLLYYIKLEERVPKLVN